MTLVGSTLLRLSAFIIVGSLLMLVVTKSGSASQIISVAALAVGLISAAISIFLTRFGRQDDSHQEES